MIRRGDRITATAGTLMRRQSSFRVGSINNISVTQNPVMILLRRYNVKISVAGFGNSRGETATVIPAARSSQVYDLLGKLLPDITLTSPMIRHPLGTLPKFLTIPTILLGLIPVAAAVLANLFSYFSDLIWFLTLVCEGACIIMFPVLLRECQRGGLTIGKEFCAFGRRYFSLREFHCEKDKIGCITITRWPWDSVTGLCRVKLTVRSESAESQTVRFLNYNEVDKSLKKVYNISV